MKNFFKSIGNFFKGNPNAVVDSGLTRLQRAIAGNDLPMVRALIRAGADVNCKGITKYPPLHYALDRDRRAAAMLLVEAGADVNLQDLDKRTPLYIAAEQSQAGFVMALLKAGADPSIPGPEKRTPLHALAPEAVELVHDLVRAGANVNARDFAGQTPLHIFLGRPAMALELLKAGANPNIADARGMSAFRIVLDNDSSPVAAVLVRLMILHGGDVETASRKGETALHLAARIGNLALFAEVLARANPFATDKQGNTPLHVLARQADAQLVSYMLAKAPRTATMKNNHGLTPLGELLRRLDMAPPPPVENLSRIVTDLLESGATLGEADAQGRTLLHHALRLGSDGLVQLALSGGAEINARDASGSAPLNIALERGNLRLLDVLLDAGADPDLTDARGWSVLDRLAEKGDRESPLVQRLIVAGGRYYKQLPIHPDAMKQRPRNAGRDKGGLHRPPFG